MIRDCDVVTFRIQSFVIDNLKYLLMLPTVLTRIGLSSLRVFLILTGVCRGSVITC